MIIPRRVHLPLGPLPAAGAFTTQPFFDMPVGTDKMTFYVIYTEGAPGGRPLFRMQWGNVLTVPGGGEESREITFDGNSGTILSPDIRSDFYMSEARGPVPGAAGTTSYIFSCCCVPGGSKKVRLQAAEVGMPAAPGTMLITLTGSGGV
jgi:hypothetical protein